MLSTLVIVALLLGALAWTVAPLLRRPTTSAAGAGLHQLDLESRTAGRLQELTDLEFDHEMGKLEEPQFLALRQQIVRETAGLMRELDQEEARAERARPVEPPLRTVRGGRRPAGGGSTSAVALALLLSAALTPGARAQSGGESGLPPGHPPVAGGMGGELTAADTTAVAARVTITLRNGTANGPGQADEVTLQAIGSTGMMQLGAAQQVRGETTFADVQIVPAAIYLVEAQAGPNRPSRMVRGQDLLAGPVELPIYEVTTDAAGLKVANVNLVVRRLRDRLEVSWLATLENGAQPPRAIAPGAKPAFELRVPGGPADVVRMQAMSGMMPTPVTPAPGSGADWVGYDRALQPGPTRVDLTASLPYDGRLVLPIEASLDIMQLTIFGFPTDLKIAGKGLEEHGVEPQTGFLLLHAPAVPRGSSLQLSISGGDPEAALRSPHGGMSAQDEAGADEAGQVVEQRPAATRYALYIGAAVLAALVVVVAVRRRTSRDAG